MGFMKTWKKSRKSSRRRWS